MDEFQINNQETMTNYDVEFTEINDDIYNYNFQSDETSINLQNDSCLNEPVLLETEISNYLLRKYLKYFILIVLSCPLRN